MPGIGVVEVLVVLVFLFLFIYFWIKEFVWLMTHDDKYFSGPYDKLIWGAAFVFIFPFAPFAFILWKRILKERGKT